LIWLGAGRLFFEVQEDGNVAVGLQSLYGHSTQWLELRALYACHDQTVELWFCPP
jgi:hypothetical protein